MRQLVCLEADWRGGVSLPGPGVRVDGEGLNARALHRCSAGWGFLCLPETSVLFHSTTKQIMSSLNTKLLDGHLSQENFLSSILCYIY